MKKLLKIISLIVISVVCLSSVACNGNPNNGDDNDATNMSVVELVKNQVHQEKTGYVFCGYFEDENFIKRAYKTFDEVPSGYYPKYQLDKSALMSYSYNAQRKPFKLEQVIYAEDYLDAIQRYENITYSEEAMQMAAYMVNWEKRLGSGYTKLQVIKGCEDEEKDKFYDFKDKLETTWRTSTMDNTTVESIIRRNTTWRAYIGKTLTTDDGFKYYIVNNEYAVIVGYENENRVESLVFPSQIEGKPVKVVSIYIQAEPTFSAGTVTIPSCVEQVVIIIKGIYEKMFDKIVFEEGVKTIQLTSTMQEDVVIPSSAYFVDMKTAFSGYNTPARLLHLPNQNVTINGNTHYYTKDGLLYTVEGDLVYQFGNREKLSIKIDENAKRVLRRSINGVAKNIYVPKNVEYFDIFFNEYSARYNICLMVNYTNTELMPIMIIESKEVANAFIDYVLNNSKVLGTYMKDHKNVFLAPTIEALYKLFVVDESINLKDAITQKVKALFPDKPDIELATIVDSILPENLLKVEDGKAYTHKINAETGNYETDWTLCSYLGDTYPEEFILQENILNLYYQVINDEN